MKLSNKIMALLALLLIPTMAWASGQELSWRKLQELVTKTSSTVSAGDYIPVYDHLTGKLAKVDATTIPFNGAAGGTTLLTAYGTCTVAAVNGGTCIPLPAVTGRTYAVSFFDIVAAGSAATCTGVKLEDTNGTPVVISTLAAATLTSGAHNIPLTATLGVGFGAGTGLTASQGVQILVNGSACTTTTAFTYQITYAVQ